MAQQSCQCLHVSKVSLCQSAPCVPHPVPLLQPLRPQASSKVRDELMQLPTATQHITTQRNTAHNQWWCVGGETKKLKQKLM